jgi:hypothetical protein
MRFALPFALLALSACSQAPDEPVATQTSAETASVQPPVGAHDDWIGRWTGVEGLFAEIQPNGDGTYTLEMQSDLDTRGTYTGTSTPEGLAFERGGETLVLRSSNGAATGLKWLADKQDCLMVAAGEGYCRD